MNHTVTNVIAIALSWSFVGYIWSGACLRVMHTAGRARWPPLNRVWKICKWPALAYVISAPVLDALQGYPHHWWDSLLYLWNGIAWLLYRQAGDDDDFKKQAKKALEKVKQVGAKLIVVPETA